eukprot:COSAG01_NODE_67818_length_266_cov_0.526946_1_plen_41_part_01
MWWVCGCGVWKGWNKLVSKDVIGGGNVWNKTGALITHVSNC